MFIQGGCGGECTHGATHVPHVFIWVSEGCVCVCARVSISHHSLLCLLFSTPGMGSLRHQLLEVPRRRLAFGIPQIKRKGNAMWGN